MQINYSVNLARYIVKNPPVTTYLEKLHYITISLSLFFIVLSLLYRSLSPLSLSLYIIQLSTYWCPTVEHMTIMFGCLVVSSDVSKEAHALGVLTGTEDVPYLMVTDHLLGLSINELDSFIGNWQQNGGDFGNDVCWFLKMSMNFFQYIVNGIYGKSITCKIIFLFSQSLILYLLLKCFCYDSEKEYILRIHCFYGSLKFKKINQMTIFITNKRISMQHA